MKKKIPLNTLHPGLQAVILAIEARSERRGYDNKSALAEALGVSRQAVSQWTRVPTEHVLTIESLLKVPRTVQRPDIYPPKDPNARKRSRTAAARRR